jgi:hypothetical protein
MPYYELYAIVIAALNWGEKWRGQRVIFMCDCAPVVAAVNAGRAHNRAMTRLLRLLSDTAVHNQWEWRCVWVKGESNTLADPLSRGNIQLFQRLHPTAHSIPVCNLLLPLMVKLK